MFVIADRVWNRKNLRNEPANRSKKEILVTRDTPMAVFSFSGNSSLRAFVIHDWGQGSSRFACSFGHENEIVMACVSRREKMALSLQSRCSN